MSVTVHFKNCFGLHNHLIRIGEFADFVSESFFDLNDGVGAETIAFGKV